METTKKQYQRFTYTQESLEKALKAITNGELSLRKASAAFKIPKSTLSNKINHKVPWVRQMGPAPELTHNEENVLAKWIVNKAKLGFPMHPNDVYDAVQTFLNDSNRQSKFSNNRPGKKWLQLFLNRHPDISKRNTEIISKARAAVTEEGIRKWFSELKSFLEDENYTDILNDPRRIFNTDETGVMTNPSTGIILGPKNYKNTYEIANSKEKESITVLCTFAADGNDVPPFVVYPYKRIPAAVINNHPDSWMIGRSDSGWMVSDTFYAYIKLFYEWIVKEKIPTPVILFLDGHKSHINIQMFEFCNENGIILFCLHPNATHILQPCDVAIFRPIKNAWKEVVRKHKQVTTAAINKQNFAKVFKEAYEKGLKPTTIRNGFRACGLYPLNPDAVDYSKCIATRRQEIAADSNIPVNDLTDYKKDMRTTMKVIESEVDANIRKEFTQCYLTKKAHDHPYFKLWAKCKYTLENQIEQVPIQSVTSGSGQHIPLDLSVSSAGSNHEQIDSGRLDLTSISDTQNLVTGIPSPINDDFIEDSVISPGEIIKIVAEIQNPVPSDDRTDEILPFPDSDQRNNNEINFPIRRFSSSSDQDENIQITEVAQIHTVEDANTMVITANQKVSSAIIEMPSEPSLILNETNIGRSTLMATEELIELILENDPKDSAVNNLPLHNWTQLGTAPTSACEPLDLPNSSQLCRSVNDSTISIDQIGTTETILKTTEIALSSLDHIIASSDNLQSCGFVSDLPNSTHQTPIAESTLETAEQSISSIDKYLTYPKIPEKQKNMKKKEPMPYGLTGHKYKEYIDKKQEEKKQKEDELEQRRRIKQEAKQLRQEKQQEKATLRQKKQARGKPSVKTDQAKENVSDNISYTDLIETHDNAKKEPRKRKIHENKPTATRPKKIQKKDNSQGSKKQNKENVEGVERYYYDSSQSKCGKYAIVSFNTQRRKRYFVGKILMEDIEEKKYKVDFLRKKSAVDNIITFVKPQIQDVTEVNYDNIERILQEPTCSRRGLYSFADVSFTDIE